MIIRKWPSTDLAFFHSPHWIFTVFQCPTPTPHTQVVQICDLWFWAPWCWDYSCTPPHIGLVYIMFLFAEDFTFQTFVYCITLYYLNSIRKMICSESFYLIVQGKTIDYLLNVLITFQLLVMCNCPNPMAYCKKNLKVLLHKADNMRSLFLSSLYFT